MMRHNLKRFGCWIWGLIALGFLIAFWGFFTRVDPGFDQARTSPLETIAANDLCAKLNLSIDDERCQNSNDVYAIDFWPEIERLEGEGRLETQDNWNAYFAEYLVECIQELAEPGYLRCEYDFQGDGVFVIRVRFLNGDKFRSYYVGPDSP